MSTRSIPYTEEALVEGLKLHDEQSYSYFYDNYGKAIFGVIFQVVPNQEAAEDILQEVFVKIWKNIGSYDPSKGRLFTWVLNIARNQAIDYTRSKEFNKGGKTISLSDNVNSGERPVQSNYHDAGLKKIVESLPEEARKLLELSYFLGYTHEEIAEMLKLPLGTVKTRLRTAIIELRKRLDINKK
ncbi:MAG TPA: sigma-70 family RNA polymerase sigma factor [Flavisolibacter sp.]|jgi:RNA polymerase sigma-70 factor (ECF subfamily)|nr:sigma-70 family RNA polymerase sigma factor [Flavisolibacter sp.]